MISSFRNELTFLWRILPRSAVHDSLRRGGLLGGRRDRTVHHHNALVTTSPEIRLHKRCQFNWYEKLSTMADISLNTGTHRVTQLLFPKTSSILDASLIGEMFNGLQISQHSFCSASSWIAETPAMALTMACTNCSLVQSCLQQAATQFN